MSNMVEGMPAVATNLQATKTDDVSASVSVRPAAAGNALGRETRSGDIRVVCRDETFVTAFLRLQEYIPQRSGCFPLHPKGRRGCDVRCPARPGTRPEAGRARRPRLVTDISVQVCTWYVLVHIYDMSQNAPASRYIHRAAR